PSPTASSRSTVELSRIPARIRASTYARDRRSSTTESIPSRPSRCDSRSPAGPAPTMATSVRMAPSHTPPGHGTPHAGSAGANPPAVVSRIAHRDTSYCARHHPFQGARMNQRLDLYKTAPDAYTAVLGMEKYCRGSVDPVVYELVKLRASILNGCSFCVD